MWKLKPVGGLPDGQNAWDYAPSLDPDVHYATQTDALRAIEAAHLGPDQDGTTAYFDAVECE